LELSSNYFDSSEKADYVSLGYNYRMSDITAALGASQLGKIDKIIALRRKNVALLNAELSLVDEICTPKAFDDYYQVYQLYTILVKSGRATRDRLSKYLNQHGISTKVYFEPIHLTHFYKNVLKYDCNLPVTEEISSKVLTLPMYPTMTSEEISYIATHVKDFFINEENKP
jgi:perosamine synthetase